MIETWKIAVERALMAPECPSVLTTAMLDVLCRAGRADAPSPATFNRWIRAMAFAGKLSEVIKGVYLNRLGHREVSPAAAAHWIRARSQPSLSWVLEQAHVTNNFGDTVTCVIAQDPGQAPPSVGERCTSAGTFRFFALPSRLLDDRAGRIDEIRDLRFEYPRATPEKALLDWIYLGASARSRLTPPPLDLDLDALDRRRIARLVKSMGIDRQWSAWKHAYDAYQADEDVRENSSARMRI